MAEKIIATFKQGDRFSFSMKYGTAGLAATLIADVKPYGEDTILATLQAVEDENAAGTYNFSTDVDTSTWGPWVCVDVWHTDIKDHEDDTMVFVFEQAVTHASDHET